MTARRRSRSSLRTLALGLPVLAGLALLGTAETIVSHGLGLAAVIVVLPVAGYGLGRWHGSRHRPLWASRPSKVLPGQVVRCKRCGRPASGEVTFANTGRTEMLCTPCWDRQAAADALAVQGHVGDQAAVLDPAELVRLRDANAKLLNKVRVLSDMVNGPKARP